MFKNNLTIAWRSLRRRRNFTAINVLGLGLGMAAAIFAFLWAQNEFSFDRFHQKADHLYRISTDLEAGNGEVMHWATTPLPLRQLLADEMPEVVSAATMSTDLWKGVSAQKNATLLSSKKYTYVSDDWFQLFDYQFIDGNPAGFSDHLRSAILTKDFAERLFGKWDVAGQSFQLDTVEFVVQAVVENHPVHSSFQHEIILPLGYFLAGPENGDDKNWGNFNHLTYVELRPGTDPASFAKKLTPAFNQRRGEEDASLVLQPLASLHFDEQRSFSALLTGSRRTAFTFAIIGFIILFLACVNYVSLTTALASMRSKEVGVRKIIGAGGAQIFRLVFSESLLTCVISLALGLGAVQLALPFFNDFSEKNFQLDPANPVLWTVIGGTLLMALLLSGIYPAMFLTGFSPSQFLRGRQFLQIKNTHFRKGLVVVQFAITSGLVIGAMVIFQQQDFIRNKDLGFDKSQVFEVQVPYSERRVEIVKALQHELAGQPSVVATSASNSSIVEMDGTHSGSLDWDGKPDDFTPTVSPFSVAPGYGGLMGLQLVEGRWFEAGNEADLDNVVLNEAAVRQFQLAGPVVGQNFKLYRREGRVIGVVKDFHYQNLRKEIGPMVMFHRPESQGRIVVKTREGELSTALAAAETAWGKHFPHQPFEYQFLDESLNRVYLSETKNAALFRLFAGLAIFISCLGLFGLAVFSTEQRTKEIGIRKVLGATTAGIVGLLSKDFLKLVVIALVIASPLAYFFMEKWLQDFAYRIDIQWSVFVIAGVVAVGVAFLTVSFQSVKAALADPVKSLKSE